MAACWVDFGLGLLVLVLCDGYFVSVLFRLDTVWNLGRCCACLFVWFGLSWKLLVVCFGAVWGVLFYA